MPKKKAANLYAQTPEVDPELMQAYLKVDQIVKDYQAGVPGAAEQLIDAFEGYLVRYYQILAHGNFSDSDHKARAFLGMFIRSPYIRQRIHTTTIPMVLGELDKTAKLLKAEMSAYNTTEIWHEIVMTLLEMAKVYRSDDGRPRFHNFVDKSYHVFLAKRVRELVYDPLVFSTKLIIQDCSRTYEDGEEESLIEQIPDDSFPAPVADEDWIRGVDVKWPFTLLTPFERRLLVWRYLEEATYREIGKRLGTRWTEARKLVQEAVMKIEKARAGAYEGQK